MKKRIAYFENLNSGSSTPRSTQNSNPLVTPSTTSLRRTHTALPNSSSVKLKPVPLPGKIKNAVSFDEHASSRPNSKELFYKVQELIRYEQNYLAKLEMIVNEYKPHLEEHAPTDLKEKFEHIFENIIAIQKAVKEFLSCLLKKGIDDIEGITDVFLDFSSMFELYPIFCSNKRTTQCYLGQLKEISTQKQIELADDLGLLSHMLEPVQHITRYPLLLEAIQKELIKQNQFSENVEKVVKMIKKEMQKGNDSIAIQSIVCSPIDLTKYGSCIERDQFKVKSEKMHKYDAMVFLFEKILVFTQQSESSKNTDFEEFECKDLIKIDSLYVRTRQEPTIIELLAKDNRRSYTLQAETNIVKDRWLKIIMKVMEEQLVEAKEGLKKRNTTNAIHSIKHCPVDLSMAGQLEMSDAFYVLKPAEFAGRIFLFEKMLVLTKIEGKNPEQYIHQASISLRDLGITTKGKDWPIFHLYDSVRHRKMQDEKWWFELIAESADIKLMWTKKIEKLLTQEQQTKNSTSNHDVSDNDVFVSQGSVKVFNMAKEEPDNLISCATKDLISAEEKYVDDLRMIIKSHERYVDAHSSKSGITDKTSYLFDNMSSILEKAKEFLNLLQNQKKEDVEGISSVFIHMAPMFELYPEYATSILQSDHFKIYFTLKRKQDESRDHIALATDLLKPIKRLPQYLVWLEDVQKNLKLPSLNLGRAINIVKKEKKEMDDCFVINSIKDCLIERNKYGSFIMSEQFAMQKPSKYEATVYLFENVVVFTKNDPNNINTYKDSIEMSALHITPFPNDELLFHLVNFPKLQTDSVDKYTFVLISKSSEVKNTWTTQIQNMLREQLQRAKEQQDKTGGVQINRRTEVRHGTSPVVLPPPKNKIRYTSSCRH